MVKPTLTYPTTEQYSEIKRNKQAIHEKFLMDLKDIIFGEKSQSHDDILKMTKP